MQFIRKPRVFLSHSKKDVDFIRRLETDLRATQCEPWIDEVELRAGKPWLDQIFESGIPSCEIVLCYFTPNSAESSVFMQELDARLIERLHSSRVTLLVYVSNADLRSRLRLDLQRLQVPELNEQNYSSAFPRLVAEVWRSYAESLVQASTDAEKVKRLEAELRIKELEGEASGSIFTASEQAEFKAIWSRIDQRISFNASVAVKSKSSNGGVGELGTTEDQPVPKAETYTFTLDIGSLFRLTVLNQKYQPSGYDLHKRVMKDMLNQIELDPAEHQVTFDIPLDIEAELLKFGFVQRQLSPPPTNDSRLARFFHNPFNLVFTSKFDRFSFWIEHNFGNPTTGTTVVLERSRPLSEAEGPARSKPN